MLELKYFMEMNPKGEKMSLIVLSWMVPVDLNMNSGFQISHSFARSSFCAKALTVDVTNMIRQLSEKQNPTRCNFDNYI